MSANVLSPDADPTSQAGPRRIVTFHDISHRWGDDTLGLFGTDRDRLDAAVSLEVGKIRTIGETTIKGWVNTIRILPNVAEDLVVQIAAIVLS